jgi:hypothetical protein
MGGAPALRARYRDSYCPIFLITFCEQCVGNFYGFTAHGRSQVFHGIGVAEFTPWHGAVAKSEGVEKPENYQL